VDLSWSSGRCMWPIANLAGCHPETAPCTAGGTRRPLELSRFSRSTVPSSHYYLRSLSWTSRTFYFLDSRDLLEVLRDFLGREREREGGVPRGSSRTLGDPPWGSLSLPRKSSENLEEVPRIWEVEGSWRSEILNREKVPRIWEGEGSWRSEIMNASNNDYWVASGTLFPGTRGDP